MRLIRFLEYVKMEIYVEYSREQVILFVYLVLREGFVVGVEFVDWEQVRLEMLMNLFQYQSVLHQNRNLLLNLYQPGLIL